MGPIKLVGAQIDFSAGLKLEFGSYNIVCNIYINSDQNSIHISDVKTICYTALFG